jgi:hypothetical protein
MSQQFGIPVGTMSIPTSWHESRNQQENLRFEGPGGVKVYMAETYSYFYSNDPYTNQWMAQSGRQVTPVKSIDRVISEDFSPYMQQQGFQYVRQFPLPQLAEFDRRFDSYLFKATPEQKQHQCVVTEWQDQQGNPLMIIIRYSITQYQVGGMDWGYTLHYMLAEKGSYEQAKKDLINALVNFRINPNWVNANNNYYANASQQSTAAHNQRMADIKAQGQAILQQGQENSRILDQNHQNFMNNFNSDNGQSQFIDYIRDETNVTHSGTGTTYKVESGSNYYWMNSNGEYISTDNPNWNPNTDPAYNHMNWNLTDKK